MKPFSKYILLCAALGVIALAFDYWNVTRKEKLLSNACRRLVGAMVRFLCGQSALNTALH